MDLLQKAISLAAIAGFGYAGILCIVSGFKESFTNKGPGNFDWGLLVGSLLFGAGFLSVAIWGLSFWRLL